MLCKSGRLRAGDRTRVGEPVKGSPLTLPLPCGGRECRQQSLWAVTKRNTIRQDGVFFLECRGPRLERARAQREKRAGGTFWCPCACRGAAAPRASLVACGRVIERARETRLKFSLHTFPSSRYAGVQTAKPVDNQKEDHSKGVAFFFWKCAAGRFEPAVRQFRCRRKLPPVWTPSCTMKNAWGSSSCITCCRVPISYLDRHTHSTCTSSPV